MAYGTTTALVGGTATLTKPSYTQFLFIQNADAAPLTVTLNLNGAAIGVIYLAAGATSGAPGGYLDSVSFPTLLEADTVVLTSTVATAKVATGTSTFIPVYPIQNV